MCKHFVFITYIKKGKWKTRKQKMVSKKGKKEKERKSMAVQENGPKMIISI